MVAEPNRQSWVRHKSNPLRGLRRFFRSLDHGTMCDATSIDPGDGVLPVAERVAALPAGVPLAVEAPVHEAVAGFLAATLLGEGDLRVG
jgi:hypothetical protein